MAHPRFANTNNNNGGPSTRNAINSLPPPDFSVLHSGAHRFPAAAMSANQAYPTNAAAAASRQAQQQQQQRQQAQNEIPYEHVESINEISLAMQTWDGLALAAMSLNDSTPRHRLRLRTHLSKTTPYSPTNPSDPSSLASALDTDLYVTQNGVKWEDYEVRAENAYKKAEAKKKKAREAGYPLPRCDIIDGALARAGVGVGVGAGVGRGRGRKDKCKGKGRARIAWGEEEEDVMEVDVDGEEVGEREKGKGRGRGSGAGGKRRR